jgi:plasmid maintenance system antidote protein VapI
LTSISGIEYIILLGTMGRPRKKESLLSRWLDATESSRDDFARKLGITRQHLDRLCRCDRRPSWELAARIEKLTDGVVNVGSWAKSG